MLACDVGPLSLALIDVDHFMSVNDRFGHPVGDQVLITVVERLVSATSGAGTLARVGGEEFALLMPGLTAEQGHRVVERALVELASAPIARVGTVTDSAGVAQLLEDMPMTRCTGWRTRCCTRPSAAAATRSAEGGDRRGQAVGPSHGRAGRPALWRTNSPREQVRKACWSGGDTSVISRSPCRQ